MDRSHCFTSFDLHLIYLTTYSPKLLDCHPSSSISSPFHSRTATERDATRRDVTRIGVTDQDPPDVQQVGRRLGLHDLVDRGFEGGL